MRAFRYVLCGIALLAVLALPVVSLLWDRDAGLGGDRRYAHVDHAGSGDPDCVVDVGRGDCWSLGALVLICVGRVIASSVAVRRARRPVAAISSGAGIATDVLERGARPRAPDAPGRVERRAGGRSPRAGARR